MREKKCCGNYSILDEIRPLRIKARLRIKEDTSRVTYVSIMAKSMTYRDTVYLKTKKGLLYFIMCVNEITQSLICVL